MYYIINKPEVVAEVIDGELVAIQLGSGCYYHSNKSGSLIWSYIEEGISESEILKAFSKTFSLDDKKSKKIVDEFIKKLLKEDLIRKQKKGEKTLSSSKSIRTKKLKYIAPEIKKHTDMKELLLLDPIHDVGDNEVPLQTVK